MQREILIRLPVSSKIIVSALGKGESKVKALQMYEQNRSAFRRVFQKLYEIQFKTDEACIDSDTSCAQTHV